jgi:hypothetical protein
MSTTIVTKFDPKRFINDGDFQRKIAEDTTLNRLFFERLSGAALKNYELMLVISGGIYIGKYWLPPLTIAGLCLLDEIDSPLVARSDDAETTKISGLDIYKALFIMKEREKAKVPIALIAQYRFLLETLKGQEQEKSDPELLEEIKNTEEKIRVSEAAFENKVIQFTELNNDLDMDSAFTIFNKLLLQPGGFRMIPDVTKGFPAKKARSFDADWLTGIVAQVSEVTNDRSFHIKWRMSIAEASYYVIQNLRKSGVKGIQEKTKSAEAMMHLKSMMAQHMNQQNQQKKK